MYNHAVKRVRDEPFFCEDSARARKDKLRSIFGKRKPEYVRYSSLPGAKPPPVLLGAAEGNASATSRVEIAAKLKAF